MVLTFISIAGVFWSRRNLRGINQTACSYLMTLYSLVVSLISQPLLHNMTLMVLHLLSSSFQSTALRTMPFKLPSDPFSTPFTSLQSSSSLPFSSPPTRGNYSVLEHGEIATGVGRKGGESHTGHPKSPVLSSSMRREDGRSKVKRRVTKPNPSSQGLMKAILPSKFHHERSRGVIPHLYRPSQFNGHGIASARSHHRCALYLLH